MIRNIKRFAWSVSHHVNIFMFLKKNKLCSRSYRISSKAKYGCSVRIGENVVIDDFVCIGDYSYVNSNSSLENCCIGKFCSISEGVKINPIEHNINLISTHPVLGENGHFGQENERVFIGNDVLISLNAIVLSGVRIGDGAVVGAGAVVTKDVPPYAVVAGVPAKIIRFRFSKEEIERLENLKWWNWSMDKIQRNIPYLRRLTTEILE